MLLSFTDQLRTRRGVFFVSAWSLLALAIAWSETRRRLALDLNDAFAASASPIDHLLSPGDVIVWSRAGLGTQPDAVIRTWATGALTFIVVFAMGLLLLWLMLRRSDAREGHGSASWATRQEIERAGLLGGYHSGTSLIVGGWVDPRAPKNTPPEYLIHSGPESIAFYAPSGSGKTVAVVIPNLLCYESSAFVLDTKGELWTATAGYRQSELGQKVLFHDPSSSDPAAARFNPLEEVDITRDTAVRYVQMLAEYLVPATVGKSENAHFEQSARSLMVGVMLYELSKAQIERRSTSIAAVLSAVTKPDTSFNAYLEKMKNWQQGHPAIAKAIQEIAMEMEGREAREFSGVLSSMVTPLAKFRDPILAAATSTSDFKLMDLVEQDTPVTLYLTIRPHDRDRLKDYFGLLVNLVLRFLTQETHVDGRSRREVLLMLEEFTSLPALPVVQQSMDVMRGYAVKAFIVLQDIESLIALYGQNETFTSNSKIQTAYTPSKPKTAKLLSEMVGTTTITEHTRGTQRKYISPISASENESEGVHGRALLTPDEILRLGVPIIDADYRMTTAGEALIFARGCAPIRGVQTPYFFDPELLRRSQIPPPAESDRIAHGPEVPSLGEQMPEQHSLTLEESHG